ncbi:MAG: class I SAM-dependent methyltransferase [Bacilli bacterium]|nr:class I SAM-dependent methyltransferase [Bacilli bacterium]
MNYSELVNIEKRKIGIKHSTDMYGYVEHKKLLENIDLIVDFISKKYTKIKICDLGIGFGKIIYLISHKLKDKGVDVEVHGVEIDDDYYDSICDLKQHWSVNLILHKADIRDFDVSSFDFIYIFHPLKRMEELYEKLISEMKKETILFDPSFHKLSLGENKHVIKNKDNYKFYLYEK